MEVALQIYSELLWSSTGKLYFPAGRVFPPTLQVDHDHFEGPVLRAWPDQFIRLPEETHDWTDCLYLCSDNSSLFELFNDSFRQSRVRSAGTIH